MQGGTKLAGLVLLALTGCGGSAGKLTIKSTGAPLSSVAKPVPERIQEARGQLALGNIGLALEGFRKAQRDDPASTDALVGMASCYDRMGRYELSRRYYESALALAPADPVLLAALAGSLQAQGRHAEAQAIQREAAIRSAPAPVAAKPVEIASAAPTQAVPLAPARSVTVKLPEAAPAPVQTVDVPSAPSAPPARPVAPPASSAPVQPAETALAVPLRSAKAVAPTRLAPAPVPARVATGPRLERISLAEVALVTSGPTRWRGEVVRRTAASSTARFVPLPAATAPLRLLNAARYQGLAARTRVALRGKGWKSVTIGDSARIRQKSLVLYSPATMPLARRLASQLGFALARDPRPGPLTILLGRDAIGTGKARI